MPSSGAPYEHETNAAAIIKSTIAIIHVPSTKLSCPARLNVMIYPQKSMNITYKVTTAEGVTTVPEVSMTPT